MVGCPSPLLAEGPGCGSSPLLAGVRCRWWWVFTRHSWLRAPDAGPRHSWLRVAGGGGVCPSPLLAEGPGCGSPPLLLGSAGWGGLFLGSEGCPVLCVLVARAVAGGARMFCVLVVSVLVVVWCACVSRVRCCAWCVGSLLLLVPASLGWGLRVVLMCVWLLCAGSSPLLAEGPGCSSPPLLSGVRRFRWWMVPRHSWLRVLVAVPRHSWLGSAASAGGWSLATPCRRLWVRFPATPGWSPLIVVLKVRSPLLAGGPGCCSPSFLPCRGLLLAVAWRRCARVLVCCIVVCGPCPSPGSDVCVCMWSGASCWCRLCGGLLCGVLVVCVCVCVWCVVFGVCHTLFGSRCWPTWS